VRSLHFPSRGRKGFGVANFEYKLEVELTLFAQSRLMLSRSCGISPHCR
jgi:hypothetical protein